MREAEARALAVRREVWRAAAVEAAIRRFGRDGFQGASMGAIAKEAGVSLRALYEVFPGKDELFAAVVDEAYGRMLPLLEQAADIPSFLAGLFELMEDQHDLCLLYARANQRDPLAAYTAVIEERIAAIAGRSNTAVPPKVLAQSLVATIIAVLVDAVAADEDTDLRTLAPDIVALYEPHFR